MFNYSILREWRERASIHSWLRQTKVYKLESYATGSTLDAILNASKA